MHWVRIMRVPLPRRTCHHGATEEICFLAIKEEINGPYIAMAKFKGIIEVFFLEFIFIINPFPSLLFFESMIKILLNRITNEIENSLRNTF